MIENVCIRIVIHLICSIYTSCTAVVISYYLAKLVRNLTVFKGDLSLFVCVGLHISSDNASIRVHGAWLDCCPMREECFVDFEERFFVVNEQIKEIALISHSKISQFNSVFSELCES
jgi:hypothetical protein